MNFIWSWGGRRSWLLRIFFFGGPAKRHGFAFFIGRNCRSFINAWRFALGFTTHCGMMPFAVNRHWKAPKKNHRGVTRWPGVIW